MDVKLTNTYSLSKARADIKAVAFDELIEFYKSKYGEGAVKMIRTKNKTNMLAVVVGVGTDENGEVNPIVITVNPTVKEFTTHSTANNTYTPYDINEEAQAYDEWVAKNEADEAAKAAKKAESEAKKAKAKAEAEAKVEETSTDTIGF